MDGKPERFLHKGVPNDSVLPITVNETSIAF
jgi:hypothetical protein